MVTMSAIWDRTAEVLRGRGSMLAGIAAMLLFLPAVAQNAVSAFAGATPGGKAALGLVAILAGVAAIWGNLALVAAASDPAADRQAAVAAGARRLGPAIALSLLLGVVVVLAALPGLAMLGAGALDLAAMARGGVPAASATPSPGLVLGAALYLLVLGIAGLWLTARLALFMPVLVNERRGAGSFARSFELTRGLTWRIIGVALLFGLLLVVALAAAQLVAALVARLLLGTSGIAVAGFVGGVAGAAVTAGGSVVSATFVAQLYRVVSGREAARAFA